MKRILGLDLARALAIYGMFASHVGDAGTRGSDSQGWAWLTIFEGRSSALFAVLMGATVVLMASKASVPHTRWRLLVRAGMLIALGYALEFLDTPVDVILVNLGVMMLLSTVALKWPVKVLAVASAVLVVSGWWITSALRTTARWADVWDLPVAEKLWSVHYPALAWMAYVFAGMALARLALDSTRVQAVMAGSGAVLAVVSISVGTALDRYPWASLEPHSYTAPEVASNLGLVLVVLAACLWIAPRARRLLFLVLATGSMALTAYVVHIVVIGMAGDHVVWEPKNSFWITLCVVVTLFATGWRAWLGAGPLERWITHWSTAVANKRAPLAPTPAAHATAADN